MEEPAMQMLEELTSYFRKPDITVLGNSISKLPIPQWTEHMLFFGAKDTHLRSHTANTFPATLRKTSITHPLFVLKESQFAHKVCPCSTKGFPRDKRFIEDGCVLEISNRTHDKRSYLVEDCKFNLPMGNKNFNALIFSGKVPSTCIIDLREK